jgi:colanic acid biosynthesis glycosyl transferase WcaI
MRLLLVTQYFWPESFVVNALAEELQKRGHQITVITGFPNYPSGRFAEGYHPAKGVLRENRNGIHIIRLPILPRGNSRLSLALNYLSFVISGFFYSWFLKLDPVDAIFCYAPSPATSCLTAIFFKWRLRKKLYFWVQDLWPESVSAVGVMPSQISSFIFGGIIRFIYKNSDRILIPSEGFRQSVKHWSGKDKKITWVPNWADPFPPVTTRPPWLEDLPKGFRVAFAGNLGKAQDLPNLVQAAEILRHEKDIKWIVVGEGSEKIWLEQEIQRRQLAESVFLVDRKPYTEMLPFFKSSDVLFVSLKNQPIFSLTIPSKVQAYMSSGQPLLAALNGEGAALMRQAQCGLVSPAENPQELAANVLKMRNLSSAERERLGKNGLEFFRKHFEQQDVISQIEKMISQDL